MTTGHVYIACSLDGFIARPDGGLDWLMAEPPSNLMALYNSFMADKDGIVMGRASFDIVRSFPEWPYDKPVVVLSRTLRKDELPPAIRDRVVIRNATPRAVMAEIGGLGWRKAYVDGGATISAFLRDGQIAELVITRLPILIGQGIPLFSNIPEVSLSHMATDTLDNGAIMSRYLVKRTDTAAAAP
jgi:dihydrofolate reductase